jgi:hypothetical protein
VRRVRFSEGGEMDSVVLFVDGRVSGVEGRVFRESRRVRVE